jgi:hypothetical protein
MASYNYSQGGVFLMSYRPHKWHFLLGIVIGWQMSQNIAMELRPEGIDFCGQVESTLILGNMVCVGLSTPLYISQSLQKI